MQPAPRGRESRPRARSRSRSGSSSHSSPAGALGWEAGGPRSRLRPRDGTGLDARGGNGRPRPGPARGGDAAVRVESRVPRLPRSRAEPPPPTPTPKLTSGCPPGSGSSNFSLALLLSAREEKTSCCGLTETRRAGVAPRPGLPLRFG